MIEKGVSYSDRDPSYHIFCDVCPICHEYNYVGKMA